MTPITRLLSTCIAYALLSQSLSAAVISTIEELDNAALFHYSLMSDLINDKNDTQVARSLQWCRNSAFVLGGGDEVKSSGTNFEDFVGTDSYYSTKFYPSIGDGECQAYGSGQSDWGAGSEFFRHIPGFWNRSNVVKNLLEPVDAWGGTPSYYAFFEVSGVTVHVLQLHYSDSARFDGATKEFMFNKLVDFQALKASEPGKHIVHVHAHNGPFIKNFGSQAAANQHGSTFADVEFLIATADLVTDSSQHKPRRFWHGDIFFDDTIAWWGGQLADDFADPNACLWYNTGIVSNNGHMEFHVFENPLRVVAQYVRNEVSTRQLTTASTWTHRAPDDLLPIMKEIDGPITYVDWNNFQIGPPPNDAEFVSQSAPTVDMQPGETQSVQVVMKNTGGDTWTSGNGHSLGSRNPQDNTDWTATPRVALPSNVAPDSNAVFDFDIAAPNQPGMYNFQWRMVDEAGAETGWFGDTTPNVMVNVGNLQDTSSNPGTLTHNAVSSPASETADKAIDDDNNTKFLTVSTNVYLQYQYSGNAQNVVVAYTITSGNDAADRDPDTATLRGSNDGSNWVNLGTTSGISFSARNERQAFNVNNVTPYEYYRLEMSHSSSSTMLQVTEVELLAPGNLAPLITSSPSTNLDEGTAYSYTLTASDADGDPFTYSGITIPPWLNFNAGAGVLNGTPANGDIGTHPVTIRVSDAGGFTEQSFNIIVSSLGNDDPVITSTPGSTGVVENNAWAYTITAGDVDGDSLTFSAPTKPAWLNFNSGSGVLSGTPAPSDVGLHPVVLSVSDGTVSVEQAFNVAVFATPSPANVVQNPSFEMGGASPTSWNLGNSAVGSTDRSQNGSSALKLTNASSSTTQTITLEPNTQYNISVWIDASAMTTGNAVFDTTDVFDGNGQGQFVMYSANSGWEEKTGTFNSGATTSITLRMFGSGMVGTVYYDNIVVAPTTPANTAPAVTSVPVTEAVEDVLYSYGFTAADAEGDPLTYSDITIPSWTTFDTGTGLLSGTPNASHIGPHSVSLQVSDGADTASQNFSITVSGTPNLPPAWNGSPLGKPDATAGVAYNQSLSGDVTDAEGDTLTFTKTGGTAVWLSVAPDGTMSGTPGSGDEGLNSVVVDVSDGVNPAVTGIVSLTVVVPADPYNNWKTTHGVTDDNADDDNDGISNMMEFALGGDPNSAGSGQLPEVSDSGSNIDFSFYRGEASVTYTIEKSTDLSNWSVHAVVNDGHGTVGNTAVVSIPDAEMSNGKLFLRLRADN